MPSIQCLMIRCSQAEWRDLVLLVHGSASSFALHMKILLAKPSDSGSLILCHHVVCNLCAYRTLQVLAYNTKVTDLLTVFVDKGSSKLRVQCRRNQEQPRDSGRPF